MSGLPPIVRKAFRHKRLGYIDAYVMYQLLQDPDHWPTADDAPGG